MPKVLLIMPKHREGDKTFPYGVATVYCSLKEHGVDVDFVDCVLTGREVHELVGPKQLQTYDIIGIGGLISCYKRVKHDIVPYIRMHAPSALLIIGGYLGISISDRLLRNRLCDAVFLGDAEESLIEFLGLYRDRARWGTVTGLAFTGEDGSIIRTGVRHMKSLEEVHVPFHKYIDIAAYTDHLDAAKRYYPLVVELGCPFRCNFCFNSSGNRPRARSPQHVIDEIKVAMEKYRPREISMMAENLLSRPAWIREFCELMDRNGLSFRWTVAGHANTINEDILRLIKDHGCYQIGIGFENFSQKILDNMNKRVKIATYEKVLRLLRRYRFEFSGTMIFGYFGEDDATIKENLEFCWKMALIRTYMWIQAYPLTRLYDQCLEKGLIKDEEAYLERLGDNTEFVLNLTEFSDEEIKRKHRDLHQNIMAMLRNPLMYIRMLRLYGMGFILYFLSDRLGRLIGSSSMFRKLRRT